jgi:uncharacterized protein (DUF924 family)
MSHRTSSQPERPTPLSSRFPERYDEILDYWLGTEAEQQPWNHKTYFKSRIPLWFDGTPSTDQFVRKNFEADVDLAARGSLDHWRSEPRSCLALIILLDQFSMNLHRDTGRAFIQSAMAIPIAQEALERGFDRKTSFAARVFFYLPLQHAEDLNLQERSVELFSQLVQEVPAQLRESYEIFLDYAARYHDVIRQFGRFPDRNGVFGRTPTPAENRYMEQGGSPF